MVMALGSFQHGYLDLKAFVDAWWLAPRHTIFDVFGQSLRARLACGRQSYRQKAGRFWDNWVIDNVSSMTCYTSGATR